MKSQTILVIDDDDNYRATVVEFLQKHYTTILEASTIGQAQLLLETANPDVAIVDIRMENDPTDISGLNLAAKIAPHVPKIMLTGYPRFDLLREALRRIGGRLPAAVDFLDKGEGLEILLQSIQKILPLRDVFVVHGHDAAAKQAVKEFLSGLNLNPILLEELPNRGKFILEKLEEATKVNYVVVLITPDDLSRDKADDETWESRARQNVILELGYFMGKLGRDRICVLYVGGVLPSDIHGLVWIRMDETQNWKMALGRELRGAGIPLDLNDIL